MHNADRDVKVDVAMSTHAGKATNLLLFIASSAARAGREENDFCPLFCLVAPNHASMAGSGHKTLEFSSECISDQNLSRFGK